MQRPMVPRVRLRRCLHTRLATNSKISPDCIFFQVPLRDSISPRKLSTPLLNLEGTVWYCKKVLKERVVFSY